MNLFSCHALYKKYTSRTGWREEPVSGFEFILQPFIRLVSLNVTRATFLSERNEVRNKWIHVESD